MDKNSLTRIPGLGTITAQLLADHHITTLPQLAHAYDTGTIHAIGLHPPTNTMARRWLAHQGYLQPKTRR